jgi:hypothetical protein
MIDDDFSPLEGISGNDYELKDAFKGFGEKEERDYDGDMPSEVSYKLTRRHAK